MDPREFQRFAAATVGSGTPAACRTAISRAYYALFNVAGQILQGLGFRISKGAAAHGEVYKCLSNSGDSEVIHVGSELNDLHSYRIRADYHMDRTDIERLAIASDLVEVAGELIRTLDAAFAGPRRAQLQATIARWRRENGYP